jgi:hypothetical protein
MTVRAARSLLAVAAGAIIGLAANPAAAGTVTTEPGGGAGAASGCTEITAVLDAVDAFTAGFLTGELETVRELLTAIPELGTAAAAAAPPDIADAVAAWVAPFSDIAAALADDDLGDVEAAMQAVATVDTEASDVAGGDVAAWATENCGWTSASAADVELDVAEPAECESLDAAAAAEAAGVDIDVTDLDGSADVNLPGLWTKSCSYGNGAMSLSTLSFEAVEDAQRFYADNLDAAAGVVLDVALGTLPESSLVIQTGVAPAEVSTVSSTEQPAVAVPATVQVAVFEAPVPFSVTFTGDDVDPGAVVAAAEAVLAAQGSGAPAATAVPATPPADAPTTS